MRRKKSREDSNCEMRKFRDNKAKQSETKTTHRKTSHEAYASHSDCESVCVQQRVSNFP